jgi:DNA polymerase I-like protein with 3'-5' exonuclease and polymerase domains
MLKYCKRDVQVTTKLYNLLKGKDISKDALELEFRVREIITQQTINGFMFDIEAAHRFYDRLLMKTHELSEEIRNHFGDFTEYTEFIPKVNNKTRGYVKGVPFTKVKEIPFNPKSRQHIIRGLQEKYGWEATEYTEKGNPKIDEGILSTLEFPIAKTILEYLTIAKIMGMIHDGKNGWLKLVKEDSRIHGEVDTMGAVTRRMTHNKPNLAQVPARGEYGHLCRELFVVPSDKVLVGCDASGLELRMLASRMGDDEYTHEILHGDIHTTNMNALGITDRDVAKTFIYAFLYGAGNAKLGEILGVSPTKAGKMKQKFLSNLPALDRLITRVKRQASSGYIKSLDGQEIFVRSEHSALNTQLQSDGAIIMKRALVIMAPVVSQLGGKFVNNIHDEVQIEAPKETAEEIGKVAVDAIIKAGEYYNLKCPLDGEYKIGGNWSETH